MMDSKREAVGALAGTAEAALNETLERAVDYPVGYCKPPIEHRFKRGEGGRKKGSRNKSALDFIAAPADDFAKHGAVA